MLWPKRWSQFKPGKKCVSYLCYTCPLLMLHTKRPKVAFLQSSALGPNMSLFYRGGSTLSGSVDGWQKVLVLDLR